MPRSSRVVIYGVLALVAVVLGVWLIKRVPPAYARYQLKRMVWKIEPWTASPNYSAAGWTHLVKTAKAIQGMDHKLAEAALDAHLRGFANKPAELADEEGKVFLLLRVVFDVRESGSAAQRFAFAGWTRGPSELNPDGTLNLAWPLAWNQGRPRLVAGRSGPEGSRYAVGDDYAYLRYHFSRRDLSSFQP